jgi:hypothetical protein
LLLQLSVGYYGGHMAQPISVEGEITR